MDILNIKWKPEMKKMLNKVMRVANSLFWRKAQSSDSSDTDKVISSLKEEN